MRGMRALAVGLAVVACCLVGSATASANHHLVKVSEVFPGTASQPALEYVELQMVASGQNLFFGTGTTVTLIDGDGSVDGTIALDTSLANGENGRRILVGSTDAVDDNNDVGVAFSQAPDFPFSASNYLDPAGGAVCFDPPSFPADRDCVSWGAFTGTTVDPTGGTFLPGGVPAGSAIERRAAPCGVGLVDTDSPSDWADASPDPHNNAAAAAASAVCPNTVITRRPPSRTTRRRATFRFTSSVNPASFQCKLDSAPYRSCTSPFVRRVSLGRHTFRVRARAAGKVDPTPATASWKVVAPRR